MQCGQRACRPAELTDIVGPSSRWWTAGRGGGDRNSRILERRQQLMVHGICALSHHVECVNMVYSRSRMSSRMSSGNVAHPRFCGQFMQTIIRGNGSPNPLSPSRSNEKQRFWWTLVGPPVDRDTRQRLETGHGRIERRDLEDQINDVRQQAISCPWGVWQRRTSPPTRHRPQRPRTRILLPVCSG